MFPPQYVLRCSYIYVCIVKGDRLALENQMVCPSLRKTISLAVNKTEFCIGMRLCGLFPICIHISMGVLHVQLRFRQLC